MTLDQIVKVFAEHLKQMTSEDRDCAQRRLNDTWCPVKGHAALKAAERIARDAAEGARSDWCYETERPFYRVAFNTAYHAIGWECAGYATFEILGANIMRETGKPFFFLPMFGFADERAVLTALQPKEDK